MDADAGRTATVAPPAVLAEEELELWRRLAGTGAKGPAGRALPPLGAAVAWRRSLAARGLRAQAAELDELLGEALRARVRSWRERVAGRAEGSEALFEALLEAARFERRLLELAPDGDDAGLAGERERLGAALARELEARAAGDVQRAIWARALLDAADDVLVGIDALPPERAERLLTAAESQLALHLAVVERAAGELRRRLARKLRRLRRERTERLLAARLEARFGARRVALWERAVLLAIVLVLVLLLLPFLVRLDARQMATLAWVDTGACAFFLWDFFYKAAVLRFERSWLARHALTDFLPSLPFGLLHAGFVLRLARLARLVRYLRPMLPLIRLARAVGFLVHGLDRMVRRYGSLLDHDVILYPTPEELARDAGRRGGDAANAWRAMAAASRAWERALADAGSADGPRVAAARLAALRGALELDWDCEAERDFEGERDDGARDFDGERDPQEERDPQGERGGKDRAGAPRARPCAEPLLRRLGTVLPEELEGELGADFVARAGRALRALARSPLRWLPIVHGWVPRVPRGASDAEATAAFTHRAAHRLAAHHRRAQWLADLSGTVTPAGLVGGLGGALVKRTARPAGRLLLLGGLFGVVRLSMMLFGVRELSAVADHIEGLVGSALLVLGSLCLVLLSLGYWMQRIASDTSSYYEQVAAAQFLHLTESVRLRSREIALDLLEARVLGPERELTGQGGGRDRTRLEETVLAWLTTGEPLRGARAGFDPVERVALLYRDSLDGSLLTSKDTRATVQILGNVALARARERSGRWSRRDEKRLQRIDLERRRTLVSGPYPWFHFITRAMAQGAARLVVDFNRNALPLDERETASAEERAEYAHWLAERRAHGGEVPDSTSGAAPGAAPGAASGAGGAPVELTTAFTALHFLDRSTERDAEVERRFGAEVRALVERDRRNLFRRVFGSHPLHRRPTEQRILNLRETYRRWLEGGRVLLLPLRLTGVALFLAWRGLVLVGRAVQEIRDPRRGLARPGEREPDGFAALRKIDRMRGPAARAALRLRARWDVEYLGLAPRLAPGDTAALAGSPLAEADARFLGAGSELRAELEHEGARAARDLERLARLAAGGSFARAARAVGVGGGLGQERVRAAVVAYRRDDDGMRSLLSAADILDEIARAAPTLYAGRASLLAWARLRPAFRRWWRASGAPRAARRDAWRAIANDVEGAAAALLAWDRHGADGARAAGERLLLGVLRHPGRVSEELVTLRAVQTLSLVDVRDYRAHVWSAGELGAERDERFEVPARGAAPRGARAPVRARGPA